METWLFESHSPGLALCLQDCCGELFYMGREKPAYLGDFCSPLGWLTSKCRMTFKLVGQIELARIHASARRGRLHCLDSAKVSPAPKAYQNSSVKPSSHISTKEAQKTLSSLPTILAADKCLWSRRDCLFEDIKCIGMEKRKMVQCLGWLGVQFWQSYIAL